MTPASAPDVRDTRAVPTPTEPSIAAVAEVCERAAMGDLEARVIGLVDHPEFGRLARAINAMLDGADNRPAFGLPHIAMALDPGIMRETLAMLQAQGPQPLGGSD